MVAASDYPSRSAKTKGTRGSELELTKTAVSASAALMRCKSYATYTFGLTVQLNLHAFDTLGQKRGTRMDLPQVKMRLFLTSTKRKSYFLPRQKLRAAKARMALRAIVRIETKVLRIELAHLFADKVVAKTLAE